MTLLAKVDLPPINNTAFMMEVPVSPEAVPIMVTGVESMIWVSAAPKGVARTFIRSREIQDTVILESIVEMSKECQWGNVLPCTAEGIKAGLNYLSDYGFQPSELEIYGNCANIETDLRKVPVEIPFTLILPTDRSYLGWVSKWKDGRSTVVVHNAARGIVVLQ